MPCILPAIQIKKYQAPETPSALLAPVTPHMLFLPFSSSSPIPILYTYTYTALHSSPHSHTGLVLYRD